MAIKALHWDFCLLQSHTGMVTTTSVIMIILLWSQCSAKAMVLKWPYVFQISRFVKHTIISGMGFQTVLSCLGVFTKGTWALWNKILLWCASFRKFPLLLSVPLCPHQHSPPHCSHSSPRGIASDESERTFTHSQCCSLHWKGPCVYHGADCSWQATSTHKPCSMTAPNIPAADRCTECHLNTPHQYSAISPE